MGIRNSLSRTVRHRRLAIQDPVLKSNRSKFTRGLDPLCGDACSAKSFKVLALIFGQDCSPVDWLQSVLKIKSFENLFLFFLLFENQASRLGGGKLD